MDQIMFVTKALLMSIIPFWQIAAPAIVVPETVVFEKHKNGKVIFWSNLTPRNKQFYNVTKMVFDNSRAWKYDLNTYVPSRTYTAPAFYLNCTDSLIILNYEDTPGSSSQISRHNFPKIC